MSRTREDGSSELVSCGHIHLTKEARARPAVEEEFMAVMHGIIFCRAIPIFFARSFTLVGGGGIIEGDGAAGTTTSTDIIQRVMKELKNNFFDVQ